MEKKLKQEVMALKEISRQFSFANLFFSKVFVRLNEMTFLLLSYLPEFLPEIFFG